jgi:serine phosphatase RsbU (regulator of sigma subunit)
VEQEAEYLQRLAQFDAAVAAAQPAPEVVLERAAGLLAGRAGCRFSEAHAYLVQLASQRERAPAELAAEMLAALDSQSTPGGAGRLRAAVDEALVPDRPPRHGAHRPRDAEGAAGDWPGLMRQVLDAMPGQHTALLPVRDEAGTVVDFELAAATATAVDLSGRTSDEIIGRPISELYPMVAGTPVWQAWLDAVADGQPREVGPFPYVSGIERAPAQMSITVHVQPVGPGLLNAWVRNDEQSRIVERVAQTERLGNLGWGETNLITGTVEWSEQLYRIFERDPALGPLSSEEQSALVHPDDQPILRHAAEVYGRGETVDITYRIRLGDRIKHLRGVVDAVRDSQGRPVKLYGIVQDVTAREANRAKLAAVEQRLREHQRSLAIEHRLTVQLQQIVLPMPAEPIDLPGLRVAIRYLPAEQASRVGGDWYHATAADDGSVLLAIGDVAGHGIHAAAVMAQLRYALSALTITTTTDPAELVSHLNRLLYAAGPTAATSTAVIGRYDPATRTLVWAQAGHLAPLFTRAGSTQLLRRPAGPLLGVVPQANYGSATLTLDPGDLLVFYTDGLVEQRDHTLAEGLAPVISTLNRISAAGSEEPLADLLAQLRRANPDDDTCILAARPRLAGSTPAILTASQNAA